MRTIVAIAALTLATLPLAGCVVPPEQSPTDAAAEAPSTGAQKAGPIVGNGERTLLQDYQLVLVERDRLRDTVESLEGERDRLTARAEHAETERDREKQERTAAEVEGRRLAEQVRDLETRVLAMAIAHAELEKELLELRIDNLEGELAADGSPLDAPLPTTEASASPPAGR